MNQDQSETHFGYQKVSFKEKTAKVKKVFSSVAENYDLMNDLMSLGLHRIWKRAAIAACNIKPDSWILDLAGGTGDLARSFCYNIGLNGKVILGDINADMLKAGKNKAIDAGLLHKIAYLQCDAEIIPLADSSLDRVIIAFGFRNVAKQQQCLAEIYRVLRPGGLLVILEFSKVTNEHLAKIYDLYSFKVIPKLGNLFANDADSYQYLAESIRMHPEQEKLVDMITAAGFNDCSYSNLAYGVCAIHKGYKY